MKPTIERALGWLLRSVRAGDRHLAWNDPRLADAPASIALASPAFAEGGAIPLRHAGAGVGDNLSPPLDWSGVPDGTAELVLIMQDPDVPLPRPVTHLVAFIEPGGSGVAEGELAPGGGRSIRLGKGSFGRIGYAGPRPVRGHGAHRYIFQIFALSRRLSLPAEADLPAVLAAMAGTIMARGRLVGIYEQS